MKLAIIGGGISGLTAAYRLFRQHDVTLFERDARLGGHTHTVDIEVGGHALAVDTGFIVYNDRTYPNFIAMLDELGITGAPTGMSFAVSCPRTGYEYNGTDLNGLFARRRNLVSPTHYRMLADIVRFNRRSPELIGSGSELTLGEYVRAGSYSPAFLQRYLLPMCAAIWSGSLGEADRFPAEHFVRFFRNHGLLDLRDRPQWRTLTGGSRTYLRALERRLGTRLRTASPVRRVRRDESGVTLILDEGPARFDQVIFACHSDEALALLDAPSAAERDVLGALPYRANEVVLHTDRRLLPSRRRAWAAWNYRLDPDPGQPATVTYHMNQLQHLDSPVPICVTLNQGDRVDPSRVLGRYCYHHPVYTPDSMRARARRAEIDGHQRSHYCGAYWDNGFHEDGVRSALTVVSRLEQVA